MEERVEKIKTWLKEKTGSFVTISHEQNPLDASVIKEVEGKIDAWLAEQGEGTKSIVVRHIPGQALLKPEHARMRLQHQVFQPGDRVVYVEETGSVPIASKGTVMDKVEEVYEVLFDHSFMGGTSLDDR